MARKYTKEELIEILQQRANELGRSPQKSEVKQAGIIARRFGSFKKGLEAAGLSPHKNGYTKEKLIEIVQQKAKELGRPPRMHEFKQANSVIHRFGSYKEGLKAAGLIPNSYTKEQLIEILKKRAEELGRTPRSREINRKNASFS
ncbi:MULTISPECIES: homing endonuclease associated repeat-containing protein [Bacillus]|uniref:Uncharacterized protein n=1 Tax=Bacillus glycinifermentans TaxID=1664069 RepID=A0A0T6BIG0_9BACI|nr:MULTISPECIES: hypothetical protein [Bacillus]KRT87142.1 hypothetical protein AB447_209255 [Bacillus glycinifermentans]MEC0487196.1 hypothetical protein [Bacillus glycinifermentans]